MKNIAIILLSCLCFVFVGACESSEPGEDLTGIDKILDDLDGLSFDDFLAQSSEQMLRRSPETITDYGIADLLGVGNDQLDNISDEYIKGTFYLNAGILELLREYDRGSLDADQQLSYDVYEFHLDDRASRQEFMYYSYTATFYGTAVHNQLELFLNDIHPVSSRQDAEDYISRLNQVDTKFEQLQEGLDLREELGIIPPLRILQWTLYFMEGMANSTATGTSYYTSFEEKLTRLDGLSQADKQDLLERAEQAIQESVLPAYRALYDYVDELQSKAPADVGYWQYDRGDDYYSYCLAHHTTTGLTAEQIHQTGLDELDRIHAEMRVLFDRLSYPQDESLEQLYARVAADGGSVSGDEIKATYEAIIDEAYLHLDEAFDLLPTTPVIVIGDVVGGFYVSPSLDGTRPGAFYANVSGTEELFGMPTLTYHEAIPGHHLQIALAMEIDLPIVRKLISFTAYAEGWALYAERLVKELGWYDNDIYGDLGRLQAEAFRAARLVVDTGIHSKRWSFDQAVQFMLDNTAQDTLSTRWEVSRYVVWPGQATAYKTGMLKILELRQYAQDQLGDQFDLKQFHNTVLTAGSVPLPVLEQVIHDAY
jgi:uncharacterized protein (DUF885 family)